MITVIPPFMANPRTESVISLTIHAVISSLPFRRMDLQPDGSWQSISFPLPRGETRDVPGDAIVHGSVLERMRVNLDYRPGNLIAGGGGRGLRKAPGHLGMGTWKILSGKETWLMRLL